VVNGSQQGRVDAGSGSRATHDRAPGARAAAAPPTPGNTGDSQIHEYVGCNGKIVGMKVDFLRALLPMGGSYTINRSNRSQFQTDRRQEEGETEGIF
jgi:hypothetical protein